MKQRTRGFTLIEILIVLAIIAILAALLFPAFKRAQESGNEANCATNLHEIYVALQLYRNDERRYPASLAFLLPNDFQLDNDTSPSPTATPVTTTNTNGTGYLKSANQYLLCPDDDTQAAYARTSYGDVSTGIASEPTYDPTNPTNYDMSLYLWNWFGYQTDGTAYTTAANIPSAALNASSTSPYSLLVNSALPWNFRNNPINYSLSNRFPPSGTIITHCIYHRLPSSNLSDGRCLYTPNSATCSGDGSDAKDIILRLDGTAKVYSVSSFNQAPSGSYAPWQQQNF